jgi:hypothetical protein
MVKEHGKKTIFESKPTIKPSKNLRNYSNLELGETIGKY